MIDAIADFFTPEVLIFLAAAVVLLCSNATPNPCVSFTSPLGWVGT